MKRRTWLALSGAAALAAGTPLPLLFAQRDRLPPSLRPDPNGLLDLPAGFSYHVLERAGERLSDGYRVPARPDGMGCFGAPDGNWILMRNHELDWLDREGPGGIIPDVSYDSSAYGGVTRLVVDSNSLRRISSNLVLTGTLRNCAGGISPWGWLSCEESVVRGHGYVFLCSTRAARVERPNRILAMGRFNHEAACIDPRTHATYLTEDRIDGCLYRLLPFDPSRPFVGRLQALRVKDAPRFEVGMRMQLRQRLQVDWIDVPEPDPIDDTMRFDAQEAGAALIRRGEGLAFHAGAVYICSTTGGAREAGQILRLSPEPENLLELVAESSNSDVLDMPDNITVAPWGDVYMAEDGAGEDYIRGLSTSGQIFDVARNAKGRGEFAGICFSPDARVLFLNLQIDGLTLAVTGPFADLGKPTA